jgi:glyoxylase-like metal-dependent hydrolase (beta-lactamase superfamily II)
MPNLAFAQITPHIFKLDLPFFGGRLPVGVWLVKNDSGWTVIDAGAPGFEEAVIQAILKHTGGEKPRTLMFTHGHADHGAAAQQMLDEWRVRVAAGRAEEPFLIGASRYRLIPADNLLYSFLQLSPPALFGRSVHLPLDEGMTVDGLEVYAAPGHAPGQMALLHRRDSALICGDAFTNLNNKLGDPLAAFTYDMALARQSQARLAELDFEHLLASHGPIILGDGQKRAKALVASRGVSR